MKYKIVQQVEGKFVVTEPQDIMAWSEVAGFKFNGLNNNPRQRQELQGQPKFMGLLGPMWDGNDTIRYEDQKSYNILSA